MPLIIYNNFELLYIKMLTFFRLRSTQYMKSSLMAIPNGEGRLLFTYCLFPPLKDIFCGEKNQIETKNSDPLTLHVVRSQIC